MTSEDFCNAFGFKDSKIISFYETDGSPTAALVCHPKQHSSVNNIFLIDTLGQQRQVQHDWASAVSCG